MEGYVFWLQKLNAGLIRFSNWGTILFMGVIAVVIPYEVFGRYVVHKMSTWSGEVSTYSLVWASMMGGAAGLKKGYQVGMTALVDFAPPAVSKVLKSVGYVCMSVFLGVMTYFGVVQTIINLEQTSPAMGIVMALPYSALPLGFFIMFLITMENLLLCLGAPDTTGGKTC
jgi:TRAP-type transport system small permease protein